MSRSKIWISSIGENFSKSLLKRAHEYTDLNYDEAFKIILPEELETSFYSKKIIQEIRAAIKDYDINDYLLISGMIILNLHIFHMLMERFGVVNLLVFRPRKGGYDYFQMKQEDYEEWNLKDIDN